MMTVSNRVDFFQGLKVGLPIGIGYIPIAVAFGLLAKSLAIPNIVGVLMSLVIYAGASQFIGVNLLVVGASFGDIVITTLLLNLRHFLMSATLSQRVETNISKPWRALLAFGVTDETFAVSVLQKQDKLSRYFVLGLNAIAFAAWNFGTWLGIFFATGVPEIIKTSMGIALYAMFIGLLIPHVKKSKPVLVVAMLAVIINTLMYWSAAVLGVSNGCSIIVATIVSAAVGAGLYEAGEGEGER